MHYYQKPQIEQLKEQVEEDQSEFDEKSQVADQLPDLENRYDRSSEFIDNYDKTLFRNNNPDQVYRFLSILSQTDPIEFDFVYDDSTSTDQYGIVQSQISGSGGYQAVLNFMTRVENSEPVQKINNLVITPVNQTGEYNNVTFDFSLQSYYDNLRLFETPQTPGISEKISFSSHNPFYPLIRNIEPNEEDLIDVGQSQLVGIGNGIAYLLDQNGILQTLKESDRVYLGYLESINMNQGNITFRLNKGGIIESVSLEVER